MENSSEASDPQEERPPLPRNPWGWILLVVLFAFVISNALQRSYGRERADRPEVKAAERGLEYSVSVAESARGAGEVARSAVQGVRRSLSEARTSLGTDPGEPAFLRVVISRELGEKPSAADLKGARAVPSDLRPAAELAIADRPDRAQVARLAPRTDGKDPDGARFSARLAAAQARERAGLPRTEARRGLVRSGYLARVALFVAGLLGASALALVLWVWYGIGRGSGTFRPRGLPSLPMTPAEADRFALRAAGMFAAFLAGSALVGLALGSLRTAGARVLDPAALVAQIGLLGGIALYALRLPSDPKVPHLSRLGLELNRTDLGRRAAWGVAAAFANVPILLIVTLISSLILKYAPAPSHPSTDALTHDPALGTVVLTFFLASVCAPIWEETMFRGLLFQGLVGARLRPVAGALLSSFLFAAIHPQGWAAWPGLMTVALMSCALLAQTRSLVPSIVMHATHNTLTLAAALIAGPMIASVLPGFVGSPW